MEKIKEQIKARIKKRLKFIEEDLGCILNGKSFYIAGNSLNEEKPNDFDLFPMRRKDFRSDNINLDSENNIYIVSKTKNSDTLIIQGKAIQLCHYHHKGLEELVESFDYAHIKIGAKVSFKVNNRIDEISYTILVKEVYFSDDWLQAKALGNTFYTGSEYPLSSIVRAFKYQKRGNFLGKSYIVQIIKALTDVVRRGWTSYDDFKDQLDAVDLGLLPEDIKNIDDKVLKDLYNLLKK